MQCIVKGDVDVIIQAIRHEDSSHPEYRRVQDVVFLAREFQFCSFSHVKRIGNFVAHC